MNSYLSSLLLSASTLLAMAEPATAAGFFQAHLPGQPPEPSVPVRENQFTPESSGHSVQWCRSSLCSIELKAKLKIDGSGKCEKDPKTNNCICLVEPMPFTLVVKRLKQNNIFLPVIIQWNVSAADSNLYQFDSDERKFQFTNDNENAFASRKRDSGTLFQGRDDLSLADKDKNYNYYFSLDYKLDKKGPWIECGGIDPIIVNQD